MRYLLILIIYLIINSNLSAQKQERSIDYRFRNGENGLASYLSKNIKYPKSFLDNEIIANSITRISITPNGQIDSICIINPIDSLVDSEIFKVLLSTKDLWRLSENTKEDDVYYIQLAFSTREKMPNMFYPKSRELKNIFLTPILIQPPEPLGNTPVNKTEFPRKFITSESISMKLNSLIETSKFENALPYVNELIKRDPFNRDLYKVRIMINIRLGNNPGVSIDDNKLLDFAEGYSLDDIIRDIKPQ